MNNENVDVSQMIEEEIKKEKLKNGHHRPNILICGYTGSGKSSLTKAILGDIVPEDAIGHGAPKTMGFDCFENDLVRIWDSKGMELGDTEDEFTQTVHDFVRKQQNDSNVDNHIHLVWYVIQGSGARVEDCELNLIKNIFTPKNVIVVITKSDIARPAQKVAIKERLMSAGIKEERIVYTSDIEGGALGCKELMKLSYELLPSAYQDAFMEAQRNDLEAKIEAIKNKHGKAKAIIATAVTAAGAAGAIPIPTSDAPIIMAAQGTMIAGLAVLYSLDKEALTKATLPFLAKTLGLMAATSLSKLIPGLGSLITATVASVLTAAIGWYVQRDFEKVAIAKAKGEQVPVLDFNFDNFKKFYDEYKKNN